MTTLPPVQTALARTQENRIRRFNLLGGGVVLLWLCLLAVLVVGHGLPGRAGPAAQLAPLHDEQTAPQREWMEIFLQGRKIGYALNQISVFEDTYLLHEEIFVTLSLMGQVNTIHSSTRAAVDRDFLLKQFTFRLASGVVSFQVTGKVKDRIMTLEIGQGRSRRRKSIELSRPPMISAGLPRVFRGRTLEKGERYSFPIFDPSTMAQKEAVVTVAGKETLKIHGIDYDAVRLETELWGQPMRFWLDPDGGVLKEEGMMGFTLVRSNAARAPRDIVVDGGEDFYALSAVDTDRPLRNADEIRYLKVAIDGLAETGVDISVLNRGRQRLQDEVLEITCEAVPVQETAAARPGEAFGTFLRPEYNIESDHDAIIATARQVTAGAATPLEKGRRLMKWVFRQVEKKPLVSVPSALEVLNTRVGDCNEHAVLLTALLRAAGVPARICVGLVYARGKFYYHAWTEGYVGGAAGSPSPAGWLSMDPTLNQIPADATHIKFAEGNLDKQMEITRLIGRITIRVLDVGYDRTG